MEGAKLFMRGFLKKILEIILKISLFCFSTMLVCFHKNSCLFHVALGLAGAQVIPKEYGCAEEDSKQYLKLAEDFLHEPQEHDSSEEPEYVDTQAIRTNEVKYKILI